MPTDATDATGATAPRRPSTRTAVVMGVVVALLLALVAGGAFAFFGRGIPTDADKDTFCLWATEAMTNPDSGSVENAVQNIEKDGVPAELADTPAHHGAELFAEMARNVGGGWEHWDGAEANRRGQDRTDLKAFLDYVAREC